ncbi:hypothetical protein RM530_08945 [Algiphilus sp. W345]|uniref:Uncharacterized protein n=1 Tax=Banduia mediterranea TaxID=3075609 RepID=A0ABU2WK92_9GAMM|nr:hypothetical protein [Algiphilus sp. W345]MDT0497487.1 hypothetical protein [Algiphilus sp. W345]
MTTSNERRAPRRARPRYWFAALVVSLATTPLFAQEPTLDEFETQLDGVIRSACHGYMVDALPDMLSGARDWLNENSPFCQTVRTLPDDAPLAAVVEEYQVLDMDAEAVSGLRRYVGRNDDIHLQCQDWMCEHVRVQVREDGHPISLADYQKVERFCEERYECIESWFKTWPRALPTNTVSLSLDALLEAQEPPLKDAATAPASGMSLDALMGHSEASPSSAPVAAALPASGLDVAASKDVTLDNVFAARDEIALKAALDVMQRRYMEADKACACSLEGTGCYSLPNRSLLDFASEVESARSRLCVDWYNGELLTPPGTAQAARARTQAHVGTLAALRQQDERIEVAIGDWEREQQRVLAQQQREQESRSNAGWLAGVAAVASGSVLAQQGLISPEQAANAAVNVARNVESGEGVVSALGRGMQQQFQSSMPSSSGGSGGGNDTGVFGFSCYDPRAFICVDYTINSRSRFEAFRAQCGQGGNQIVSGGCDRSGPSCSMQSAVGKQTTFSPMSQPDDVKQACLANGGQYSLFE